MKTSQVGLLRVLVVCIVFESSEESRQTILAGRELNPDGLFAAVVSGSERDELACWWEHSFDGPLLVVRSPLNQRYSDALALIKSMPGSAPLAILTHRPRSESRRWGRRTEFDTFVREAEVARSDVQVHIYSSTWRTAPPRVR